MESTPMGLRILSYGYANPRGSFSGRSQLIERELSAHGVSLSRRWISREKRGKKLKCLLQSLMPYKGDAIYLRFPYFLESIEGAIRLKKHAGIPLVVDAMVSLYDTLVLDRRLFSPDSREAVQHRFEDDLIRDHADLIIVDTELHRQYFTELLDWDPQRMVVAPLGSTAVEHLGTPPAKRIAPPETVSVIYAGSYVPLHGVEVMIKGLALAAQTFPGLQVDLFGDGQHRKLAVETAGENPIFKFHASVSPLDSLAYARGGDIVLGIFGDSRKARSLLPFKGYDALAMGCCLVTARTPTSEYMLRHGEDCWLTEVTPEAIAAAILELAGNPELRKKLCEAALASYRDRFSPSVTTPPIREAIDRICRP